MALGSRRASLRSMREIFEDHIAEAIVFIREHEPPEGYFVAFSGGKDSLVLLHLVRAAMVKHECYYNVGIEPPEVRQFVKKHYPETHLLYPHESFFETLKRKFPPLRTKRWCCDTLRKYPSRPIPLKHRLMGLRAEESLKRSQRPMIDIHKREHTIIYKPIFHWKEWEVWEYIEQNEIAYPSLYDEGWDRVGCVVCPFICSTDMRQILRNKARWPGFYKAFEHAVTAWFQTRQAQGAPLREKTPGEYLEHWYKGITWKEQSDELQEIPP
jgi:phosphoadenosine phosphosulfate reductase